ncbi:hypothetical protein BU23DRAFT_561099 [Bimuria novae-zelandiae CBS 107.79]|uniref:Uncharacterized protein n=1 Tax=Bimuria novae-zelandiae CBS 107.79 TaxID=1447943 RepID=A0A6A5UNR3_9PLEO|nr:hypothetical protein BU23DRAFT_561099 [Bimuria novae-zelandiae CBS 107.79]
MPQLVSKDHQNTGHKSNFLFLANKQIHSEYMGIIGKKSTVHLTVASCNYAPPTTAAEEEKNIWQVSPQVIKQMKRCNITLATTSTMLGVPDPRNMKSEEWALARQIGRQLAQVRNDCELNLIVKAISDPLWNPLWIWYHAAQALKTRGQGSNVGPKFNRITFCLDTFSPGENYLMRDPANSDQWAWWCLEGHCVAQVGVDLTVRQFCSGVYGCPTCDAGENEEST